MKSIHLSRVKCITTRIYIHPTHIVINVFLSVFVLNNLRIIVVDDYSIHFVSISEYSIVLYIFRTTSSDKTKRQTCDTIVNKYVFGVLRHTAHALQCMATAQLGFIFPTGGAANLGRVYGQPYSCPVAIPNDSKRVYNRNILLGVISSCRPGALCSS